MKEKQTGYIKSIMMDFQIVTITLNLRNTVILLRI